MKCIGNQKVKKKELEEEILTLVFSSDFKVLEKEIKLSLNSRHAPHFTAWEK